MLHANMVTCSTPPACRRTSAAPAASAASSATATSQRRSVTQPPRSATSSVRSTGASAPDHLRQEPGSMVMVSCLTHRWIGQMATLQPGRFVLPAKHSIVFPEHPLLSHYVQVLLTIVDSRGSMEALARCAWTRKHLCCRSSQLRQDAISSPACTAQQHDVWRALPGQPRRGQDAQAAKAAADGHLTPAGGL